MNLVHELAPHLVHLVCIVRIVCIVYLVCIVYIVRIVCLHPLLYLVCQIHLVHLFCLLLLVLLVCLYSCSTMTYTIDNNQLRDKSTLKLLSCDYLHYGRWGHDVHCFIKLAFRRANARLMLICNSGRV